MKIDILICTYNDGIKNIANLLMPPHPDISYKISHQVKDYEFDYGSLSFLGRKDIVYNQINSVGLSKNRNNVMRMATGDICFIADDDVRYEIDDIISISKEFENNPDLDIYVGKIRTYPNEPEYKLYATTKHKCGISDIGHISSIEIIFRNKSIKANNISFDENFGLKGNLFNKGEEAIFLSDCLRKKLNIIYFPIYIVKHPFISSTRKIQYNENEAQYFGSLNYRLFGSKAYITSFIFAFKHFKRYSPHISIFDFFKGYFKGIRLLKNYQS